MSNMRYGCRRPASRPVACCTYYPALSLRTGCLATSQPFTMSWIIVPSAHRIIVGERGNGDAVIGSDDAGTTWTLRDHGIEGTVVGQPVRKLYAAPGDATVMYAVTMAAADPQNAACKYSLNTGAPSAACAQQGNAAGLFVTRDGG